MPAMHTSPRSSGESSAHKADIMATGLQELGVDGRRLRLITALCSSPGLKRLGEEISDLTLHTACIDEGVDGEGQIDPGIGDPVRRLKIRS